MIKILTFILLSATLCYSCSPSNNTETNYAENKESASALDSAIVTPAGYEYPDDTIFKVLSWNVEHFVDPYDDPYIENGREDNPPENMPLRLELFLKALRKADSDIVVLQEFESAKYLRSLAMDSLTEMGYQFFADVPSHGWYMNVVLMSRFPLGIIYGYGNATTPLPEYTNEEGKIETQSNINTRMWTLDVFPAEDYSFMLTGVHLKAGRSERDIAMRKGQLNLLKAQFSRFIKENPDKNMMIAGDFNAIPGSEEMYMLLNAEEQEIRFLDVVDTSIYSHPSDAPSRRLDYMLVNQNMQAEIVKNDIQVKYFFSEDSMKIISDHLPVLGHFYTEDKSSNP